MKRFFPNQIIPLPKPESWKVWILIALIAKGLFLLYNLNKEEYNPIPGFWGSYGGDTESYLSPIENLVNSGSYTPDYRMPGYGVFYLPFYYYFSKPTALNLLILTHLIFAAIATYCLGLIARYIFQSDRLFYFAFWAFTISTFSNLLDHVILTESLTASLLIISVYAFLRFQNSDNDSERNTSLQKNCWLMLSGLILTEVIFLKPVYLPLIFLFSIVLVRSLFIKQKPILQKIFLFLLPFIIIDGSWMVRNYPIHQKIAPLTTSFYYPGIEDSTLFPVYGFVQSWGGNIADWETEAEIRWFGFGVDEFPSEEDQKRELPAYIFTSAFNLDSLKISRRKIVRYDHALTLSPIRRKAELDYITQKLKIYTQSIKREKPFLYYIRAPFSIAKKFFIHSGTNNLFQKAFSELPLGLLFIKIFYSLFYVFTLVFGFIGLILLAKRSFQFEGLSLITGIVVYTTLIHPFILRFADIRYFYPAWPFLLICAIYAFWRLQKVLLPRC